MIFIVLNKKVNIWRFKIPDKNIVCQNMLVKVIDKKEQKKLYQNISNDSH